MNAQLSRIRATTLTILHSSYVGSLAELNGVPAERCRVVPYFVEAPPETAPLPAERVVCFAGRVVGNKGLDLLLEALALRPGAWDELLVAGDGWARPGCAALARRLGIANRVRFLGWTSRVEALEAIRSSRVLALPSRWPEPFGISGLEAGAEGRPVVATAVGGVPEWLVDGETGLLVPPGDAAALADAIAAVLADDALARRLGDGGRRNAARFAAGPHLDALERVYRELLPAEDAFAGAEGAR